MYAKPPQRRIDAVNKFVDYADNEVYGVLDNTYNDIDNLYNAAENLCNDVSENLKYRSKPTECRAFAKALARLVKRLLRG